MIAHERAVLGEARRIPLEVKGELAALGVEGWQVRDAGRFAEVQVSVRERQAETMRSVVAYTGEVLSRYQEVVRRLADMPPSDGHRRRAGGDRPTGWTRSVAGAGFAGHCMAFRCSSRTTSTLATGC